MRSDASMNEVPVSVKQLQEWCALQKRIDSRKNAKTCRKLYYCKICGIHLIQKSNLIRHAEKSHPSCQGDCAELLDNVESYYYSIKDLPDLERKAKQFVENVNAEIRKGQKIKSKGVFFQAK